MKRGSSRRGIPMHLLDRYRQAFCEPVNVGFSVSESQPADICVRPSWLLCRLTEARSYCFAEEAAGRES